MMRFSTLPIESWSELAPYVDTLCLPIYSLQLSKQQLDVTKGRMIEFLVDSLEKRLAGRMLLLPSIPYTGEREDRLEAYMLDVLTSWRNSGFRYVVLVMDNAYPATVPKDYPLQVYKYVLQTEDTEQLESLDDEVNHLYEEVLKKWVKNG